MAIPKDLTDPPIRWAIENLEKLYSDGPVIDRIDGQKRYYGPDQKKQLQRIVGYFSAELNGLWESCGWKPVEIPPQVQAECLENRVCRALCGKAGVTDAKSAMQLRLSEAAALMRGGKQSQPTTKFNAESDPRLDDPDSIAMSHSPKQEADTTGEQVAAISVSEDGRSANWNGQVFLFTTIQAACFGVMFRNWTKGTPFLSQAAILELGGSATDRLSDVFDKGKHPAWGTLIIHQMKGLFGISEPIPRKSS